MACAMAIAVGVWSFVAPAQTSQSPGGAAVSSVALAPDQARAIAATLEASVDQGFAPGTFLGLADLAKAKAADAKTVGDVQERLVQAVLALARAEHGQRLPTGAFPSDWVMRPQPYDPAPEFAAAVAGRTLGAWLTSLAPADPRYAELAKVYVRYRAIAANGGWPQLPTPPAPPKPAAPTATVPGATITPPKPPARVPPMPRGLLRARLAVEDPELAAAPTSAMPRRGRRGAPDPAVAPRDPAVRAALSRARVRYGLSPDGGVDAALVEALNVPASARLEAIRANLERWRWAPRDIAPDRIEVNIADQTASVYEAGVAVDEMRVIVGKPAKATPMFQDRVVAVVFNPPWNVPDDIARAELWPKIRGNPGYAARHGFAIKPGGGLQQRPGPGNSLGSIKFELTNNFGIYLHDTNARSLFASSKRALSHGCIRLADPRGLAERLLVGDPVWTDQAIDDALTNKATVWARLKKKETVDVFYWTAFVNSDGAVAFRPDVYGWDQSLRDKLAHAGQTL